MTAPLQDPAVLTVILNWRTADMTLGSVAAAETAMQGIAGGLWSSTTIQVMDRLRNCRPR